MTDCPRAGGELNPLSARIVTNCGLKQAEPPRIVVREVAWPKMAPGPPLREARAFRRAAWTVSRILSAAEAACSHFSGPAVADWLVRATRSGTRGRGRRTEVRQELLALARGGVCRALPVTGKAVRSYRTVSPLPRTPRGAVRRSVLCCTVPRTHPRVRVAVSHHRVQPCPDFPPAASRSPAAACPRGNRTAGRRKATPRAAEYGPRRGNSSVFSAAHAALMAVIFTRRYSCRWPAWRR